MMTLTDDQRCCRTRSARSWRRKAAIKQLRHWRDTGCTDGFGTAFWKQFAELGLTGILIPRRKAVPASARSRRGWCSRRSAATSPPRPS